MPEQRDQAAGEADEERVLISGRVRASVRKRLRMYAAANDENLQDLLDRAIDEYLKKRGG
ncbi:ribbon-helix-helix domain-containing protein [Streptomyces sp. NPDC005408]|uniref:ribbon-helix-helix domain-containing protein n=1 Tax=Streptomyces sp. NPDC005408 TaxID=3155341 RepID=UPI00339E6F70